jgi:CHAT domain-containing protein/tetratricopeptide (TPR) repeat protein
MAAAREAGDRAGEAQAQRERALALARLDRRQEAVAAWREAAAAWQQTGDGPGQVEALGMAGALLAKAAPREAEVLVARAVALAQAERQRPLAAAQALDAAARASLQVPPLGLTRRLFTEELALLERWSPRGPAVADCLNILGTVAGQQGDIGAAQGYLQRALVLQEQQSPGSLDVASTLVGLGTGAFRQADWTAARQYYLRALAIWEQRAPGSPDMTSTLNELGLVAYEQSDLPTAKAYHQRALALRQQAKPDSLDVADSLNNLGLVVYAQGDLDGARTYYQRALAVQQKLAPRSPAVAHSLNNLGVLTRTQGDLAAAREYHQQALALREQIAPGSLEVADSFNNLGIVASDQGDQQAAIAYYAQAYTIQDRLAPGSLALAQTLNNLGVLSHERGDLADARQYFQRALEIREQRAPGSLSVAASLTNLGVLASDQGDRTTARELHARALALKEELAPESESVAASLDNLGALAREERDLAGARQYYERALRLQEKLAPHSPSTAESLYNLGVVAQEQGDWREAERLWRRAWGLVRQQATAVRGDVARRAFGAATAPYAARLVEAQLVLGKREAAFATLEEGRAQALQQLLSERGLDLRHVPAALRVSYQSTVTARDRAEQRASELYTAVIHGQRAWLAAREQNAPPAEVERLLKNAASLLKPLVAAQLAFTQARLAADQRWAEVRRHTSRILPPPLSLSKAARSLPPGTLFIAFSVGEDQSHVFLVHASGAGKTSLTAYPVRMPLPRLRASINAFREQVGERLADPRSTAAAARTLFRQLFPPEALPALRSARRLLISPDGPLWEVPFAALVLNAEQRPLYLGAEKPISYTQSFSLYAQSRSDPPRLVRREKLRVLVVGDPVFDRRPRRLASGLPSPVLTRGERGFLFRDGSPPARLPATRVEALRIAHLYDGEPLLGERATEAAVRPRLGKADVIHVATHGLLHPVHAMSSGLLLAAPEKTPPVGKTDNDGILQAWEVYSQLKLRAELVVLSACETGRGESVRGEGIVGLTRALQSAGARAIVASQWAVADQSTAALMVAFHRKLRMGLARDEALRQAMAVVRADPRTSHPYYWAPFFLTGDPGDPSPSAVPRRRAGERNRRRR